MKYLRNQWDRAGAWLCVIAGAIALVIGYFGVSGTLETGKQIPYVVSGGLVGLFLLGLGALLWLSADLRDEWRKLDRLERAVLGTGPEIDASDAATARVTAAAPGRPVHAAAES